MRQTVLLPQTFLPFQSVRLGRLVLNVQQPHSDFFDLLAVEPQDILVQKADRFRGEDSNVIAKDFGSALTRLLSLTRSKQRGITTSIVTDRVTTYLLNNSGKWFHQAVQSEDARKWIEDANRRGDDIYLVSGYYTVFNAQVRERSTHGDATTTAPGEQVGAVQYRKVQFKWYSSRELHDKPLGRNQWKTYWTLRGQTDDIIEADLADDLELADDEAVCVYDEESLSLSTEKQDSMKTNV